jgi:phage-related protein
VWDGIKTTAGTTFDNIKTTIGTAWDTVKTNTGNAWDAIQSSVDQHGGGIKGIIGTAVDAYKSIWETGFSKINDLTGGNLAMRFLLHRENLVRSRELSPP